MHIILGILGVLVTLFGFLLIPANDTLFGVIAASMNIGFGLLIIGAAAIITRLYDVAAELRAIQIRIDAREEGAVERHTDTKKIAAVFDKIAQRQSAA